MQRPTPVAIAIFIGLLLLIGVWLNLWALMSPVCEVEGLGGLW